MPAATFIGIMEPEGKHRMQLTKDQKQSLDEGRAVPLNVDGSECVLLRKDVYERVRRVLQAATRLPAEFMDEQMSEYDAGDPLLERYQQNP